LTKIRIDDNDDPIDICYDNVFKAMFTKPTPESQGALSRLVSALIGREVTVDTITANEPPIYNLAGRQVRFDIACRAKTGESINVDIPHPPNRGSLVKSHKHSPSC
jgi:hypothetical protein